MPLYPDWIIGTQSLRQYGHLSLRFNCWEVFFGKICFCCVYVCLPYMCVDVQGNQKRILDPIEFQGFQAISCPVWVLGTELFSSAVALLTTGLSLWHLRNLPGTPIPYIFLMEPSGTGPNSLEFVCLQSILFSWQKFSVLILLFSHLTKAT